MKLLSLISLFSLIFWLSNISYANTNDIVNISEVNVNTNSISGEQKISNLAQNYSLTLVENIQCRHCKNFKSTFDKFIEKYKFNSDIIQISPSNITKSHRKLMDIINAVPTVILFNKASDKSIIFSQGNVPLQHLEQTAIQVWDKLSQTN
ncbi:thioredoxin family protein [Orientia chuto str. Dubai]|uniref:Thioredoxin family protein n=1 Tax=Orientia chuto str. Dubai TaxID=1359168 RepID=A0A0F3MJ41_9RICK|nr:conjugal transfer protein TraF [Candidatus Orientia mediorientalis]KJV55788.1 thioredoxin family protein [Orientia chuto str. Dubai]